MKAREFFNKLLFYMSQPRCVACKTRLSISDLALCPRCKTIYEEVKSEVCSVCLKPVGECLCVNAYLKAHYIRRLSKVYRYNYNESLPSNRLIYSLKSENRIDVADFLANELRLSLENAYDNLSDFVFVSVPRRKSAKVRFGYDHAELLAKRLAKILGASYCQRLSSKSKYEQKKTSGKSRIKNARFIIKNKKCDLTGKRIILVDDIVTTGASMGASAMLLRALGAEKIYGAAISIAYNDTSIK